MDNNRFYRIISFLEVLFIIVIFAGCGGGGGGSAEHPLSVSITSPPRDVTIHEGESVNFQATASGGTIPYTYEWTFVADWGPGGSSTSSIGEKDPGEIIFDKAGIYNFTLTVTDATGAIVSEAVRVNVKSP